METSQLITALIKDDLINTKLIDGLSQIGLCAGDYHLFLSDTIFNLMGLENYHDSNNLYDHYITLTKQVRHLDLSDLNQRGHLLDQLASTIYNQLLLYK